MPSPSELFFGIVFSIIGMSYAAYGRKHSFYFLLAGLSLVAISFFSLDMTTYLISGAALIIGPFILYFLGF